MKGFRSDLWYTGVINKQFAEPICKSLLQPIHNYKIYKNNNQFQSAAIFLSIHYKFHRLRDNVSMVVNYGTVITTM